MEPLNNHDEHHVHGACNPLKALAGRAVDAVIVGGIGAGAVRGLRQAGIAVFRSPPKPSRRRWPSSMPANCRNLTCNTLAAVTLPAQAVTTDESL